jgi:hypothetical protein
MTLSRADTRIVVSVAGGELTATRSDGTMALRFTGGTAEDAQSRCTAYLKRMERLGWEVLGDEEMR